MQIRGTKIKPEDQDIGKRRASLAGQASPARGEATTRTKQPRLPDRVCRGTRRPVRGLGAAGRRRGRRGVAGVRSRRRARCARCRGSGLQRAAPDEAAGDVGPWRHRGAARSGRAGSGRTWRMQRRTRGGRGRRQRNRGAGGGAREERQRRGAARSARGRAGRGPGGPVWWEVAAATWQHASGCPVWPDVSGGDRGCF